MLTDGQERVVIHATDATGMGRLTAHEFVRETLRAAILRGELRGGSRLIQADVAAQLDVSTTPVREALRDLATEGLITLDRHRGGVVRELDWDSMQEVVAIRRSLEPLALQLAFERITEEEIATAEQLYSEMMREKDLGRWIQLNRRFHFVFHQATGSPRLRGMMRGLQDAAGMYVAQAQRWRPDLRRRANTDHRALLKACRRGDLDAAADVQYTHVALAIEGMDAHRRPSSPRPVEAAAS